METAEVDLIDRLRSIVGEQHVLIDAEVMSGYVQDWTGRWQGSALAVVRPACVDELTRVVRLCVATKIPLRAQGGNTGLVAGATPQHGEILLSTRRLNDVGPIDVDAQTVSVGAGTSLAAVQSHVRAHGFDIAIDFAARESATIGGIVATNAGGERVLRHGMTRFQVRGLEAVLPDGSLLTHMSGLPKNNAGYDLTQILIGSEGTLGIITRVLLQLIPLQTMHTVALVAVANTAAACRLVTGVRPMLPALEAAEIFHDNGLRMVLKHTGVPAPFRDTYPTYVLLETAGRVSTTDGLVAALESQAEVLDAVVTDDITGRRNLWKLREAHSEAINAAGTPIKLDVAVPLSRLPEFEARLHDVIETTAPATEVIVFGHIAEGNLHINLLGAANADADGRLSGAVLQLTSVYGGSVSAEHGVGRAKARWLNLSRSQKDIDVMHAIKVTLDPDNLFSPGTIFA